MTKEEPIFKHDLFMRGTYLAVIILLIALFFAVVFLIANLINQI